MSAISRSQTRDGLGLIPTLLMGFGIAAALVLATAIPPALASFNGLMVSTDGVTYKPGNQLPLFEAEERLVPGDQHIDAVWVRNDSEFAANLRIDAIQPVSDSPDFAAALTLSVTQTDSTVWEPVLLGNGIKNGSCTVLANKIMLQPGETTRLDVTATLSEDLGRRNAAKATAYFSMRGVLQEVATPDTSVPGAPCEDPGPSTIVRPKRPLVPTGAEPTIGLALLGGAAIGGAILFGVRAWRRRPEHNREVES